MGISAHPSYFCFFSFDQIVLVTPALLTNKNLGPLSTNPFLDLKSEDILDIPSISIVFVGLKNRLAAANSFLYIGVLGESENPVAHLILVMMMISIIMISIII